MNTQKGHDNHRYWRVKIREVGPNWPIGTSTWLVPPYPPIPLRRLPDFNIHKQALVPNSGRFSYKPAKACIYCGANSYISAGTPAENPLHREHIIPDALGGDIILPQASCHECEGRTSFENTIIVQMFDAVRRNLAIRTKKGNFRKAHFPVTVSHDAREVCVRLHIGDHPTILVLPILIAPRNLVNAEPGSPCLHSLYLCNLNVSDSTLERLRLQNINTPNVDMFLFCQLLAKIAHAYASAELGPGSFASLHKSLIEKRLAKNEASNECFDFIGGNIQNEGPSRQLHELGLGYIRKDSTTYVGVRIRLFAKFNSPSYYVLAGAILR